MVLSCALVKELHQKSSDSKWSWNFYFILFDRGTGVLVLSVQNSQKKNKKK